MSRKFTEVTIYPFNILNFLNNLQVKIPHDPPNSTDLTAKSIILYGFTDSTEVADKIVDFLRLESIKV